MVFSSITFLVYFMPLFFFVYYLLPGKFRNGWLLFASILFFSWGAPVFIFTVIASCFADHLFASQFAKEKKKLYFISAVVLNLALLVYFKYANFFLDNFNFISKSLSGEPLAFGHILLPVGISFLIFHKISFLSDVYRKQCDYPTKFSDYLLFILLFPHLIAGPIVRFKEILPQIQNRAQNFNSINVYSGLLQFIIGLSKKVLIANVLGLHVNDKLGEDFSSIDFTQSWVIIIAYAMQLYFDFSGYSDMAIGLAKMMGFEFPENFRFPYTSKSITEFWKRWHITLGRWMRDYLYIPLGGNQSGALKTYMNLLLIFFLSGLWHGASWNFVIWGLFHGVFLVIERIGLGKYLQKIPAFISVFYTLLVVITAWVFFRIDDFNDSVHYIKIMYSPKALNKEYLQSLDPQFLLVLMIALVFSLQSRKMQEWWANIYNKKHSAAITIGMAIITLALYALNLGELYATGFNPFIYFKF